MQRKIFVNIYITNHGDFATTTYKRIIFKACVVFQLKAVHLQHWGKTVFHLFDERTRTNEVNFFLIFFSHSNTRLMSFDPPKIIN